MKKMKVLLVIIVVFFKSNVIAQSSNPPIIGMGTSGYIPVFNSANNLVNSSMYTNLSTGNIFIGTTIDNGYKLNVGGSFSAYFRGTTLFENTINIGYQTLGIQFDGSQAEVRYDGDNFHIGTLTGGATYINESDGSVLIGTTTDNGNKLRVVGNTEFVGNIGIGTPTPLSGGGAAKWLTASGTNTYGGGIISSINGVPKAYYYSELGFANVQGAIGEGVKLIVNESTNALTALSNGYVGIGTTNPSARLTVKGDIHSREVKVTVDAGADFVFEKNYDLPSLTTLDTYIKENKHLPEIASASEMKENGINLSEMNIKLLQKIEELTLYIIEMKKENQNQNEKITALENRFVKK